MNSHVQQAFDSILAELHDLNYKLNGWGISRPGRSPTNSVAWEFWYQGLTDVEKKAENELRRKGYYNHEGVDTMFNCLDSEGKQIHTDDEVLWGEVKAVVTCIFSENEIQINPLGEGLPELLPPNAVKVTQSFIEKLRSLRSNEELQAILTSAEARLEAEMAVRKTAVKRTTNQAPRAVKPTIGAIEL